MLTGKQKRYLRGKAHHLNAIFQVGKEGVNSNQAKGISEALESQELLKVNRNFVPETVPDALELSVQTKSEVVQIIGHTIILYKSSDKELYRLP